MNDKYPFTPKSNSKLKSGQFWAIKLRDGFFACGIVLDVPTDKKEHGTRSLYVGLLNWKGEIKPTVESLESTHLEILKQGYAHVKTISVQEEEILGIIDLEKNNLSADMVVDTQNYLINSYVLKGFRTIRKSTKQDHEVLNVKSTWGYEIIIGFANNLLAD